MHLYNVLEMGLSAIRIILYFFDLPFRVNDNQNLRKYI